MHEKFQDSKINNIRFFLKSLEKNVKIEVAVLLACKEVLGENYLKEISIKNVETKLDGRYEVKIAASHSALRELFLSLKPMIERTVKSFSEEEVYLTLD